MKATPASRVVFISCLLVVAHVVAAAPGGDDVQLRFDTWRMRHGRVYATAEDYKHRLAVFTANWKTIASHNARSDRTFAMGLNKFSDLTFEEWASRFHDVGTQRSLRDFHASQPTPTALPPRSLPSSVNWTAAGVFGPVRDDGVCSAAWSFTVTETISALEAIHSGQSPVALSPQQLIDCTAVSPWGLSGCHGGWPQIAYTYVTTRGLCTAASYPFHASLSVCEANCTRAVAPMAVSYGVLPPNETAFMARVAVQPPMTAIGLSPAFQHYKSGVLSGPCNVTFEHCVTIAGYGTTSSGQDYWLIRNNFGASWGEQGYFRLARGVTYSGGLVHGECDVLGLGMYPTLLNDGDSAAPDAESGVGV